MSLRCLFLRHQPMLTSIVKREHGYAALCDHCGLPIERGDQGSWAGAQPLTQRHQHIA